MSHEAHQLTGPVTMPGNLPPTETEPMISIRRDAVAPDGRVFRVMVRVPARRLTEEEVALVEADVAKKQALFLAEHFPTEAR